MVAVDSTFFPYLLKHETRAPNDPATSKPIERLEERIDLLIETLQKDGETIIIPTPALSEFLVLAKEAGPGYLDLINKSPLYDIQSFDTRAAIELAAIRIETEKTLSRKELKRQTPAETWAKISFDRQIVAIAKVNHAHTIYSEDETVGKFALANNIQVVRVWELPVPKAVQGALAFPDDEQSASSVKYTNVTPITDRPSAPRPSADESDNLRIEVKGDE